MATVPTPSVLDYSVPRLTTEDFVRTNPALFIDEHPKRIRQDYIVAFSTTILENQVVGLTGGKLVPAVQGTTQAIGVAVFGAVNGAAETKAVAVYRSGHFNQAALVWPASYDTDAKKITAFDGAPSPSQILVSKVIAGA